MAKVLRNACSSQQQQEQPSQQQHSSHSNTPVNNKAHNGNGVSASAVGSGGGVTPQAGSQFTSIAGELPPFAAGADLTPRAAAEALLGFATAVTQAQRTVLEDAAMKSRGKRDALCDVLAQLPGKLDHASVVVYKVGS